jgi:hypothetical protein
MNMSNSELLRIQIETALRPVIRSHLERTKQCHLANIDFIVGDITDLVIVTGIDNRWIDADPVRVPGPAKIIQSVDIQKMHMSDSEQIRSPSPKEIATPVGELVPDETSQNQSPEVFEEPVFTDNLEDVMAEIAAFDLKVMDDLKRRVNFQNDLDVIEDMLRRLDINAPHIDDFAVPMDIEVDL